MKTKLLSIALLAAFCAPLTAAAQMPPPMNFGATQSLTVQSGEQSHEFTIEIADTQEKRTRGLMFRDEVTPDQGMLFELPNRQVTGIWMVNTSIFLDILFVDADGRIVKIEHSAKPYSKRNISSERPVVAVLELAGGQSYLRGIRPGDMVEHAFFDRARP